MEAQNARECNDAKLTSMKFTIKRPVETEITHVRVILPVRYGEEDIPNDFPMRIRDVWEATINVDTGQIEQWPIGKSGHLGMKVCDEGTYILECRGTEIVGGRIEHEYVPHGLIPGEYGDYVDFQIDENGNITNWPKKPDVRKFFGEDDD